MMRGTRQFRLAAVLLWAAVLSARDAATQIPNAATDLSAQVSASGVAPAPQVPLNFDISGTKFSMDSLMRVLKDGQHEGWVLAAYPDPKTSRPLIGAGFSLDVEAREHVQSDQLNPNQFLEPSSAQLWDAAGLDPKRLQEILDRFERNLAKWNKKTYRKKVKAHLLPAQVTDAEATQLLRVSSLQATHNAKAYCRGYDQLTASQQMALSQLVFQMGVNLEEFVQFLGVLSSDPLLQNASLTEGGTDSQVDHWKAVQQTLIDSQWARRYTTRAVTVIAMFDPNYEQNPKAAQQRIQAVLRPPPAKHKRKKAHPTSAHTASTAGGENEPSAASSLG